MGLKEVCFKFILKRIQTLGFFNVTWKYIPQIWGCPVETSFSIYVADLSLVGVTRVKEFSDLSDLGGLYISNMFETQLGACPFKAL